MAGVTIVGIARRAGGMLAVAVLAVFLWTGAAFADSAVYRLRVDGLTCPFCAYGIEKRLSTIGGVLTLKTDIAAGVIIVTMKDGKQLGEAEARRAVEAAGFVLRGLTRDGPTK